MALKTSFLNDRTYSAADINAILSRIVSQGISPEYEAIADAKEYHLDRLNDLTKSYVERGVAYQGDPALKLIKIDDGYYISPGTAFFGNGTVTEVTANEKVEITYGAVNYIYMISDTANNSNYIVVADTMPNYNPENGGSDNIIPIASVDGDGNITDMRFYARGKLPGFHNEDYGFKKITFSILASSTTVDVDLGTAHLSMILCRSIDAMTMLLLNSDSKMVVGVKGSNYSYSGDFLLYYKSTSASQEIAQLINVSRVEGTTWRFTYENGGITGDREVTLYYV